MQKNYILKMPKKVFGGKESLNKIKDIITEVGCKKILLLTDEGIYKAGLIDRILPKFNNKGIDIKLINNIPTEPKVNEVNIIYQHAKKIEADMLIAMGGGSVIDVTKLIAVLKTSKYSIYDIVKDSRIIEKGIITLMIPTTAGTGAEATPNAIVTIPEKEIKVGVVNDNLIADYVILDPSLTLELPKKITASTGIDALAHALECYISKKANPFSDIFALKAIELIFNNLEKAYNDGNNLEARNNMLLASFYGGVSIATSSTVAVHALAYPLGGKYGIPHGVSNAMLLAEVMAFNKDEIVDKLACISDQINKDYIDKSTDEKAKFVIDSIFRLVKSINIPDNLKECGISEKDINSMVKGASKVTRLLNNNPKKMTKKDIYNIYKKLI